MDRSLAPLIGVHLKISAIELLQAESFMQTLEKHIREMTEVYDRLSPPSKKQLDFGLSRLTTPQLRFIRLSLGKTRCENGSIEYLVSFLEHIFETWWVHRTPTKLAALARIGDLVTPTLWPPSTFSRQVLSVLGHPPTSTAISA